MSSSESSSSIASRESTSTLPTSRSSSYVQVKPPPAPPAKVEQGKAAAPARKTAKELLKPKAEVRRTPEFAQNIIRQQQQAEETEVRAERKELALVPVPKTTTSESERAKLPSVRPTIAPSSALPTSASTLALPIYSTAAAVYLPLPPPPKAQPKDARLGYFAAQASSGKRPAPTKAPAETNN